MRSLFRSNANVGTLCLPIVIGLSSCEPAPMVPPKASPEARFVGKWDTGIIPNNVDPAVAGTRRELVVSYVKGGELYATLLTETHFRNSPSGTVLWVVADHSTVSKIQNIRINGEAAISKDYTNFLMENYRYVMSVDMNEPDTLSLKFITDREGPETVIDEYLTREKELGPFKRKN